MSGQPLTLRQYLGGAGPPESETEAECAANARDDASQAAAAHRASAVAQRASHSGMNGSQRLVHQMVSFPPVPTSGAERSCAAPTTAHISTGFARHHDPYQAALYGYQWVPTPAGTRVALPRGQATPQAQALDIHRNPGAHGYRLVADTYVDAQLPAGEAQLLSHTPGGM
jgi:hypothetical protein